MKKTIKPKTLAQRIEHDAFNITVLGSNPRCFSPSNCGFDLAIKLLKEERKKSIEESLFFSQEEGRWLKNERRRKSATYTARILPAISCAGLQVGGCRYK